MIPPFLNHYILMIISLHFMAEGKGTIENGVLEYRTASKMPSPSNHVLFNILLYLRFNGRD